jgi:prepilin signal peptidase PulO-like enzyme (type II secretory pathway)
MGIFRLVREARERQNGGTKVPRAHCPTRCQRANWLATTLCASPRNGFTLLDLLTASWIGIVGACIGSFLNVVAYRMPRHMSVVWKPSHCPKCDHDIRARDNVPVLGWLMLRGRCRDCQAPISPRYAIVEAVMGTAFFLLAYAELNTGGANLPRGPFAESLSLAYLENPPWPLLIAFAFHATLLSLLMAAALIALDEELAPVSLLLFAAVVVVAATLHWRFDHSRPYPCAGGNKAGEEAALGFAVGAILGLITGQFVTDREIGERERRRRNLALSLATVGGFLGLGPLATILFIAAIGAGSFVLTRRDRQSFFRTLPAGVFAATLAYVCLWNRFAALWT